MSFFEDLGQYGERTAFLDDRGQAVTYRGVEEWAKARMTKNGLRPRTIAFCLCENSVGSALGYVSFLHNGIVPLLLDRRIDSGLLSHLMDVYRPACLYYPADMRDVFGDYEVLHEEYQYILAGTGEKCAPQLDERLGLLLTTSGSTGSPKLVRQSYRNIQSNAEVICGYLHLDETERPVTTLPMSYTYGLSIINIHLQAGATVLLTDKSIMMKKFWDFVKEQKATSLAGVPSTYELLKKIRFFKMELPYLRYMTEAGGKLSPELHREFAEWARDHGKEFIIRYGQTESTANMAYLPPEHSVRKAGSIGIAIPGGRFTLADEDGRQIETADTPGELIYEGDNVTLGYAQCLEDLAKGDERGGRLETGDIAKRDAEGFYYIVGRKKRFLKIFGNRVSLDEIDMLVKSRWPDMDCASAGVDDRMKTYITDGSRVDEVRQYLSNITRLSESAFDVRCIPAIPKNEAGKVLYSNLVRDSGSLC